VSADVLVPPHQPRAELRPAALRHRLFRHEVNSPVLVHGLSLVAAAIVLVRANWGQWFFGDEWAFLVSRDLGSDPWRALFAPHNEHWSTIPVLVWRAMFHLVGLHSYLPYAGILIVTHLLLAHVLWRAMRRCGAGDWVATGLAAVFAVLGAGSDNILWAFQIGFIGSVVFGYVAAMLTDVDQASGRRLVGTWLASAAALMCSGIGVVMVGVVTLVAWQRRGLGAAAAVLSAPAALFAVWYMLIGNESSSSVPKSRTGVYAIPDYVASGLTQSLERTVGLPGAGAVLVVAIVIWLVLRASSGAIPPLALSTAVGAVLLYAFIAPGREALGLASAGASRYVYLCIALLLPPTALLVTELLARTRWPALLAVALAGVLAWHNLYLLVGAYNVEAAREATIRRQVLAAADIAAGETWLRDRPDTALDPDITMEWLRQARAKGWLDADEGTYTLKDELDVRARTQVSLSTGEGRSLPPLSVVGTRQVQGTTEGDCTRYTPVGADPQLFVRLDPGTGGSARLVLPPAAALQVILAPVGTPGVLSEPVVLPTPTATTQNRLDIVARVDQAILTLPSGGTTLVCGVLPASG
jgi:hypothetical protein